jgi:hypothetical protein
MATDRVPDSLPVLSRGKHRSARKGACFMEMASVLANEPWSDHPSCTHPLLAGLARLVNDHTSDHNRSELAVLIPSVVGLRGGGLPWVVDLTSAVALQAIPDVPEPSQRALAAGLIRCEQLAATLGPDLVTETDVIRRALDRVPGAVEWSRRYASGTTVSSKQFAKHSAPSVMRCAVRGLVDSATPDPDARLRDLLRVAITTAQRLEPQQEPGTEPRRQAAAQSTASAAIDPTRAAP